MTKPLNYTNMLLKIKKSLPNESPVNIGIYHNKPFSDYLNILLNNFKINNNFYCKETDSCISYSKEIEYYLSALITSIDISEKHKKNYVKLDNDILKNKFFIYQKKAFLLSGFGLLLHSTNSYNLNINDIISDGDDKFVDGDDEFVDDDDEFVDDDESDDKYADQKYVFNPYFLNIRLKCDESLRPLCNAILKNIDKYPFKPQLPNYYKTEEYQKKRHPNKQSKGANTEYVKNPLSEYPITDDANERLHYTTMELARANSKLLSALTPDLLDAILTSGNVTAVEYFKFMIDPTYQNPNLEDPNNARKFYFLTYKHFFKSIPLENNELKLFHYFTVESILKGTILFSFCNFFVIIPGIDSSKISEVWIVKTVRK